jgi:hypothetical protein
MTFEATPTSYVVSLCIKYDSWEVLSGGSDIDARFYVYVFMECAGNIFIFYVAVVRRLGIITGNPKF